MRFGALPGRQANSSTTAYPSTPLTHDVPQRSGELEDAPVGGWGILLIKNYTRDRAYRHSAGKNILRLSIPKHSQTDD